jgi:hypothetical protein
MPLIALSLFPSDVDSLEHPQVVALRQMIEAGCAAFDCRMTSFAMKNGVVFVGVTSDEFAKEIMHGIAHASGRPAEVVESEEEFCTRSKGIIEEKRASQA